MRFVGAWSISSFAAVRKTSVMNILRNRSHSSCENKSRTTQLEPVQRFREGREEEKFSTKEDKLPATTVSLNQRQKYIMSPIFATILLTMIDVCLGCSSSSAPPPPIYQKDNTAFIYNFTGSSGRPVHRGLQHVIVGQEPTNDAPCDNPFPGSDTLNKGQIPNFFAMGIGDEEIITKNVYPLRCPPPPRRDREGRDIPIGLEEPLKQEHTLSVEMTKWYDDIVDLVFDVSSQVTSHQWSQAVSFFHHQKSRKLETKCSTKAASLGVVFVSYKIKTVIRNDNITAFEDIVEQYKILPSSVELDPLSFFKFTQANGIALYRKAVLGGRIIINILKDACQLMTGDISQALSLTDLNSSVSIADTVKHLVNASIAGVVASHVDLKGGNALPDYSIREWMQTVPANPVILGGTLEPLSAICDKRSLDPVKSRSFQRYTEYEKAHQDFKRLRCLLPLLTGPAPLVDAVQSFVLGESDKVTPNVEAVFKIKDILQHYASLGGRTVTCSRNDKEGKQLYVKSRLYYLVPHLCISDARGKYERCDDLVIKAEGIACVWMYPGANCSGEPKLFTSLWNGFKAIDKYSSYRTCTFRLNV